MLRPLLPLTAVTALFIACGGDAPPPNPDTSGGTGGTGAPAGGSGGSGVSGGVSGTGSPTGGQGGSITGGAGGVTTTGGSSGTGTGGGVTGGTGGAGGAPTGGNAGTAGTGGTAGAAGGSGGTAGSGGSAGNGGSAGSGSLEWLPSWATTIQGYESSKSDHVPPIALPNNTLRQFVWPTFTGGRVRLQLSNEKGAQPLQITKVAIALAKTASDPGNSMGAIDTASSKPLTFGGMAGVTIPAGQTAWSDGIDFPLQAVKLTAVTIQFGAMVPAELTTHPGSRTTSYFGTGDAVATESPGTGGTRERWYFINAIEVMAPADAFALGALGDSITDGYGILNKFERWTDYLTVRIQADATLKNKVSVLNFGMGANNLTSGSTDMDAGKDRFRRDVLARPKVKWVIVLEGVNDINGGVQATAITSAYREIVTAGHGMNIKIFGSPITPMGSNNSVRTTVNTSVRNDAIFDQIVDFDAAIRDSANQNNIATMYNNDGLHPNAAGYQKMAEAVNLSLLVP